MPVRLVNLEWTETASPHPVHICPVPAGFPSPAEGEEEDPIDLSAWLIEKPAASYLMRVDGHSMTGAGINDRDLIVLKRLDDRLWLVPEAEGYPHTIVDEYVEIWGVVVGLARQYR